MQHGLLCWQVKHSSGGSDLLQPNPAPQKPEGWLDEEPAEVDDPESTKPEVCLGYRTILNRVLT